MPFLNIHCSGWIKNCLFLILIFYVVPVLQAQEIRKLSLPARDLYYDVTTQRIYASVSNGAEGIGDSITAINPATGAIGPSIPIGSNPGKLALSADGQYLYVALDGESKINRLALSTQTAGTPFSITSSTARITVLDMEAVPDNPNAVAVVQRTNAIRDDRRVVVYENGVARRSTLVGSSIIEFGNSPSRLYGYDNVLGGISNYNYSFYRMRVDNSGVHLADFTRELIRQTPVDFEYAGGRLYTTQGQIIDPEVRTIVGRMVGASGPVLPDPQKGRVYYIFGSDAETKLLAYDLETSILVGSLEFPEALGKPGSLIRWGEDGLAFRTSQNQVFLVRTSLVPRTDSSADLSLNISDSSDPIITGNNLAYTLTVNNQGPSPAVGVVLEEELDGAFDLVDLSPSQGSCSESVRRVRCTLGALEVGSSVTVKLTLNPLSPGWIVQPFRIASLIADPEKGNNHASEATEVRFPAGMMMRRYRLPTNDVLYDGKRQRLYASIPSLAKEIGNRVISLDPSTGAIDWQLTVGNEPNKLAISDNSRYLYVGVDGEGVVRRIDLDDLTADLHFSLGSTQNSKPFTAYDMEVLPGNPYAVAVSRSPFGGIVIYDNGVSRANVGTLNGGSFGYTSKNDIEFEFSPTATRLYATDRNFFNWMAVDASGVIPETPIHDSKLQLYLTDFKFDGKYLHLSTGRVFDPEALREVEVYVAPVAEQHPWGDITPRFQRAEPDPNNGRDFFVTTLNNAPSVYVYDRGTARWLGTLPLPNVTGIPSHLLRWGSDGLALRLNDSSLLLARTPLTGGLDAADLSLQIVDSPEPAQVGSPLNYHFTVTNRGLLDATGVTFSSTLPQGSAFVSVMADKGVCSATDGAVQCQLGVLPHQASAVVTLTVTSALSGTITATGSVSSATPDSIAVNNTDTQTTLVSADDDLHSIRILTLPSKDLEYDPTRNVLYATTPVRAGLRGNSIAAVNPATGELGPFFPVGSVPHQLAVSGGGEYAYTYLPGIESLVRLNLGLGVTDQRFQVGNSPIRTTYDVSDLEVSPGNPNIVAAAIQNGEGQNDDRIAIYENGIERTNVLKSNYSANVIEFNAEGTQLYSYNNISTSFDFIRMNVDSTGLTYLDRATSFDLKLILGLGVDIKQANNLIYASSGRVVDPETRQVVATCVLTDPQGWQQPNNSYIPNLVYPDLTSNRIFFLVHERDTYKILAFDAKTYIRVDEVPVPGVEGIPSDLIRWGTDGLAFRTSEDQIYLIRTSLVPSGPGADIAITQTQSPQPVVVGENLTITSTLTNQGPLTARSVVFADTLPKELAFVSAETSRGTCSELNGMITCAVGDLAEGQIETVTVVVRPMYAGNYDNTVRVASPTLDPSTENNALKLTVTVFVRPGADQTGQVRLYTTDMVYDRVSELLYASVPDTAPAYRNQIAVIDPATGEIRAVVPIGEKPGKLALSDDGQFLYVALGSGNIIRRLDLRTLTPGPQFSLGKDTQEQELIAREFAVLPGRPEALVISYHTSFYPLEIFENGVKLPNASVRQELRGLNFASPTTLYGMNSYQINRLSVTGEEMTVVVGGHTLLPEGGGGEMIFDSGFLFLNSGWVIDPEARHPVGRFTGLNTLTDTPFWGFNSVAPDIQAGRVAFLVSERNHPDVEFITRILAYDSQTYRLLGEIDIPGVIGETGKLLRWGEDGLAFRTEAGQIYLLRTSLLKPHVGAVDLSVELTESHDPAVVNNPLTFTATVTNRSEQSATGVTLTNSLPTGVNLVSATASSGECFQTGGEVRCDLGALGHGAVASVFITVTPAKEGALHHRVHIRSAEFDTDTGNNLAFQSTRVEATLSENSPRISRVTLPTNDLVYHPPTQTFYASVPGHGGSRGNTLTAIDPLTGVLGPSLFIGSEPSRLEMTDDDRFIFAALDALPAVRRINLSEGKAESPFLLAQPSSAEYNRGPFYALDMEAVPGDPSGLAVLRRSMTRSGSLEGVAIYDSGFQRPETIDRYLEDITQIEYSSTASVLYGYSNYTSRNIWYRIFADAAGVSLLDVREDFITHASEFKRAGNLLYSSAGQIIDPESLAIVGTFEGIPPASNYSLDPAPLVEPDLSTGRVYFLVPLVDGGKVRGCNILVYDLHTRNKIGTLEIPDVIGVPNRLTRWGEDGLAFRTSDNQIFFVRSLLVPGSGAMADLSVTQTAGTETASVGTPLTYTLSISNRGPDDGVGVRLAGQFSPHVSNLQFGPGGENCQVSEGGYTCAFGTIAKNDAIILTLTVTPIVAGEIVHDTWVAGDRSDLESTNDRALTSIWNRFVSTDDSIFQVGLPTEGLAYDNERQLLYASVQGQGVRRIDPNTGAIGDLVLSDTNPGDLAIDDRGTYLYAGVEGGTKVQRVDLAANSPDLRFSVSGTDPLMVLPQKPDSLLAGKRVLSGNSIHSSVSFTVYDNGQPRYPSEFPMGLQLVDVTLSNSPEKLYGVDSAANLYHLTLQSEEIKGEIAADNILFGRLQYEDGRLYSDYGRVIDPEKMVVIANFSPLIRGYSDVIAVRPDSDSGRVFILVREDISTSTFTAWEHSIRVYDLKSSVWADTIPLPDLTVTRPGSPAPVGDLVLWGHDGLAFRTTGDQIYLIRTSLRRLLGDVDGNGMLNVQDAVMVLRATVGVLSLTTAETDRGDFNQDKKVDVIDAVGILRRSVGL